MKISSISKQGRENKLKFEAISNEQRAYYKEILKLALEAIKEYSISKVVIACEYSNIPSKRGIEHIFKKEYKTIPVEGTYYLVYEKELGKKE